MTTVKTGDTVAIHYTGTLLDGTKFDSSDGRDPLQFEVGSGQIIPGLDVALPGMAVGDKKTVNIACADAYGTLFDVAAAARQAASEPDHPALADKWAEVASHWRHKQLQYTWLRAISDAHCDFWQVTQDGLDWALEATGLHGNDTLRQRLLDLIGNWPPTPKCLPCLGHSRKPGCRPRSCPMARPTC